MAREMLWAGVVCVFLIAVAKAETPDEQFQKLYGEAAAAAAKSSPGKEAAFAAKLVYDAGDPEGDPALARYLLEKAYEFGCKTAQGSATAILAARIRMDQEAEDKQPWREKLLAACRIGYQKSNGPDKTQAADTLICELTDVTDALSEAGKFAEALKPLKECRQVAMAVKSPRIEGLTDRLNAINAQIDAQKKYSSYVAKLKEKPGDAATAKAAVLLCVVQMDDPGKAAGYAGAAGDDELKKFVPMAAQDVEKLSADDCAALAGWYQALAKKASRLDKVALLKRTRKCLMKIVEEHSDDAQGKKVRKQLDETAKELAALTLCGRELVLDLGQGARMRLVRIAAGKFIMGGKSATSRHPVTLSKAFYMGVTGVTQQQYEAIMGVENNHSRFKGSRDPVECVTWEEATEFCRKLSRKCGCAAALPTDAQREYACRAGSQGKYCFGDDPIFLDDYAWYRGNHGSKEDRPHPVGQKKPNAWGLYDMHGNVYEWCGDWFEDWNEVKNFSTAPVTDPVGPETGNQRVQRGAVWSSSDPEQCQSSLRIGSDPTWAREWVGFRIIVEAGASSTKAPG